MTVTGPAGPAAPTAPVAPTGTPAPTGEAPPAEAGTFAAMTQEQWAEFTASFGVQVVGQLNKVFQEMAQRMKE